MAELQGFTPSELVIKNESGRIIGKNSHVVKARRVHRAVHSKIAAHDHSGGASGGIP